MRAVFGAEIGTPEREKLQAQAAPVGAVCPLVREPSGQKQQHQRKQQLAGCDGGGAEGGDSTGDEYELCDCLKQSRKRDPAVRGQTEGSGNHGQNETNGVAFWASRHSQRFGHDARIDGKIAWRRRVREPRAVVEGAST